MLAITRAVSPALARCELSGGPRVPIDVGRAVEQHAGYERALEGLGCSIERLPASAEMPDCVFVEDTAVVLDEVAVIARPGAASRRPETAAVDAALARHRPVVRIEAPATLDGGDVLTVGRLIFVGRSRRTNDDAAAQLRTLTAGFGYVVRQVSVEGCLHLKSAVTAVGDRTLLVNREWVHPGDFAGFELLEVAPGEAAAANIVQVGKSLLCAAAYPRTLERLERRGFRVTAVDVSEIAKADGAVTCCSLVFNAGRDAKDFGPPAR